jgi:hypothetical protein
LKRGCSNDAGVATLGGASMTPKKRSPAPGFETISLRPSSSRARTHSSLARPKSTMRPRVFARRSANSELFWAGPSCCASRSGRMPFVSSVLHTSNAIRWSRSWVSSSTAGASAAGAGSFGSRAAISAFSSLAGQRTIWYWSWSRFALSSSFRRPIQPVSSDSVGAACAIGTRGEIHRSCGSFSSCARRNCSWLYVRSSRPSTELSAQASIRCTTSFELASRARAVFSCSAAGKGGGVRGATAIPSEPRSDDSRSRPLRCESATSAMNTVRALAAAVASHWGCTLPRLRRSWSMSQITVESRSTRSRKAGESVSSSFPIGSPSASTKKSKALVRSVVPGSSS